MTELHRNRKPLAATGNWFTRLIGRWRLRKTRREMADAIAQIRAEEKARLLAKRERALQAIAESSGVPKVRQW